MLLQRFLCKDAFQEKDTPKVKLWLDTSELRLLPGARFCKNACEGKDTITMKLWLDTLVLCLLLDTWWCACLWAAAPLPFYWAKKRVKKVGVSLSHKFRMSHSTNRFPKWQSREHVQRQNDSSKALVVWKKRRRNVQLRWGRKKASQRCKREFCKHSFAAHSLGVYDMEHAQKRQKERIDIPPSIFSISSNPARTYLCQKHADFNGKNPFWMHSKHLAELPILSSLNRPLSSGIIHAHSIGSKSPLSAQQALLNLLLCVSLLGGIKHTLNAKRQEITSERSASNFSSSSSVLRARLTLSGSNARWSSRSDMRTAALLVCMIGTSGHILYISFSRLSMLPLPDVVLKKKRMNLFRHAWCRALAPGNHISRKIISSMHSPSRVWADIQ